MPLYVIRDADTDLDGNVLYWSNDVGWVELGSATVFTEEECVNFNLPIGGELVMLPPCLERKGFS